MQFVTSKKQKEQKTKIRFSSYQLAVSPFISDAVFHEVSAANDQSLIKGFIGNFKQTMVFSLVFALTFFSFIFFHSFSLCQYSRAGSIFRVSQVGTGKLK